MTISKLKTRKRKFVLGKGYTHFAVNKETNLILSGWDYKGYDKEDLKLDKEYYFFNDLADWFDDFDKKTVKIITRAAVEKLGIVIEDSKYWVK
ncbi:MAG: hypothetical protein JZU53_07085 [Paludibacter sp.]|nr:hypothetical protein [Paludibacter sp.]